METISSPNGVISYERDDCGYPRIKAKNREEAAFAQGYLHANDRMVQVHINLMMARGRLMQFVGDRPLFRQMDRSFRKLNLEKDAKIEARETSPRSQKIMKAYCDGFNTGTRNRKRPLLLKLLNIPTETFSPAHIVLLHRQAAYLGLASLQQRAEEFIAELAQNQTQEALFSILLGDEAKSLNLDAFSQLKLPKSTPMMGTAGAGSSAWVVSKEHSKSGGALFANDFHLPIGTFPPLAYAYHIEFPDNEYLMGMGMPGIPTILSGRNPELSWGATYAYGDTVDILLERCKNDSYEINGEWFPLVRREEEVKIRAKFSKETWVFYENDYGVIDGEITQTPQVFLCLRWTGARGVGRESIDGVLGIETCRDVKSGASLLSRCRTHSVHYLLADVNGEIAYTQTGKIDKRPDGISGACPRPGWKETNRNPECVPQSAYPLILNPEEGVIVSANERVDGPDGEQFCTLPHPPYRAARLREMLLKTEKKFSLQDMAKMQYDEVDIAAKKLLAIWAEFLPEGSYKDGLCAWANAQKTRLSTQEDAENLALFLALHHELTYSLLAPYLGKKSARVFVEEGELLILFQHHIDNVLSLQKPSLLDKEGLQRIIQGAWPLAVRRASIKKDISFPKKASFKNMFFEGKLPKFLGFDSDELSLPGNPHAPFQLHTLSFAGMDVLVGPLFHVLFDMSQPGGWYNIAGGASESRSGPGYGKGLMQWKDGQFLPLGNPISPSPSL